MFRLFWLAFYTKPFDSKFGIFPCFVSELGLTFIAGVAVHPSCSTTPGTDAVGRATCVTIQTVPYAGFATAISIGTRWTCYKYLKKYPNKYPDKYPVVNSTCNACLKGNMSKLQLSFNLKFFQLVQCLWTYKLERYNYIHLYF